jgi:hypothetical protein
MLLELNNVSANWFCTVHALFRSFVRNLSNDLFYNTSKHVHILMHVSCPLICQDRRKIGITVHTSQIYHQVIKLLI